MYILCSPSVSRLHSSYLCKNCVWYIVYYLSLGPRVGIRRNGDVEGVRQSSGNWQRDNNVNWNRGTLIKAVDLRILRNLWQKQ